MRIDAPTTGVETAEGQAVEHRGTGPREKLHALLAQFDYRIAALYAAVFAVYFYLSYFQAYHPYFIRSDLPQHIAYANQFFNGQYNASYPGLYIMWFVVSRLFGIATAKAAVFVDSLLAVSIAVIIRKVLQRSGCTILEQVALTGILMIVTPIYDPFFNPHLFVGQISSTIYHNPTLLAVKPFAYLSVMLFVGWLRRGSNALLALTGLTVLCSTVTKPNFVMAFAVALPVYLLLRWRRFDIWWKTAALFVPSVIALAIQYVITYQQPGEATHVGIDFLAVWKLYSPNPLISIVISLLFPLCVLTFRWKQAVRNELLVVSWLTLCVGIVEYAVFAEIGTRFKDGNFSWGMEAAVPMVFLFSVVEWVRWMRGESSKRLSWAFWATNVVLALHVASGAYYLLRIMTGHAYYL